ncbi:amino acid adenylation domain-containing protein [Aldersonia sp. NBC_00410]|uniref:non-ribosomal peptide synthetase n=1 Tax=Aldersonia sp. NBC_00410 TaxID=2975954 RepID=UPI00224DEAF9|nr:non-ribosomal peptide synthetase [Aldersonia sp. NBC_00410]MCX5043513.1 amino acid adenylation domain-containing protein [Aldersonia sp. NBC_00410]
MEDRKRALLRRRLAEQGLAAGAPATAAPPRDPAHRYPLSAGQRRMWFLQQVDPAGTTLNICVGFTIEGPLDPDRMRRALGRVVATHDVLRTTYHADEAGEPHQTVAGSAAPDFAVHDLADLSETTRVRRLEVLARREFARAFDLSTDLPLRAGLVRESADRHVLVLVVHHIAWDDDCWDPFFAELSAAYDENAGTNDTTPDDTGTAEPRARVAHYLDLEVLERPDSSGADAADLEYWRGHITTLPEPLELPGESGIATTPSPAAGRAEAQLPGELLGSVAELARAEGATTFMVLLAAFNAVVHRYTGADEFLVATPVVQRRAGAETALGYFGNTLALRAQVGPRDTFRDLVGATRTECTGAFAHQGVGLDRLVAELNPDRSAGLQSLARLSFAARTGTGNAFAAAGFTSVRAPLHAGVAQVPLSMIAEMSPAGGTLEVEYLVDVLDEAIVTDLLGHYVRLLTEAVRRPDTALWQLDTLGEADRAMLLRYSTGADAPTASATIPALVQAQVARTPDAVALVTDEADITFAELDARANRLARWLIGQGIGPDDLVALSFGRSPDMVITALGVMKAGAAYVPIDPTYPADRIAYMLADSAPKIALSADDRAEDVAREYPSTAPTDADRVRPLRLSNLAYVIYTSGSTGLPKGVPVEHRAIVEYLEWLAAEYAVGADDALLQVASTSFDVSVGEMFGTISAGARLVIPKPDGLEDIPYLTDLLLRRNITSMHFVPSLLGLFLMLPGVSEWKSLRRIPIGGEPLPGELADKFTSTFDAMLHNFYGPTETTLAATRYKVEQPQGVRTVPIGSPKPNTQTYLLDSTLQLVPVGAVGEVYIGGSQLARGYLGRAGLSAERFVADPFNPGGRLYRTGDLARWNIEGDIEFVGRADEQVKIRGFRIELGEVQSAVTAHPSVAQSVVVAAEVPSVGKILAAYVVAARDGADAAVEIDLDAVRAQVAAALPEYMVPAAFTVIDEVPITANGKLDRAALPEPVLAQRAATRDPETPTEIMLAELFATALGVDRVGAEDSFFDLGGHSLLATKLISRVRAETGAEVNVREAFESPTVAGLAALIDEKLAAPQRSNRPVLRRADRGAELPLSYAQLRQWFLYQLEGANPTYNIPFAARLEGTIDVHAMASALSDLVGRHEILRTSYPDRNGTPYQHIHEPTPIEVPIVELGADGTVEDALIEAMNHCFELSVDLPVRAQIFHRAGRDYVLSVVIHHIAADEWSTPVLFGDLLTAYTARLAGHAPSWSELPVQYADFALWQRELLGLTGAADADESIGARQVAYWREKLAGVPEDTTVVKDRLRPQVAANRGATVALTISPRVRAGLTELARATGASDFMVLQTAVAVLLHKLGAGSDIPLGTPIAGRTDDALAEMVGFFVNTLVVRNDLAGDPTVRGAVGRAKSAALEAYEHQELPFERLVDAVNPERSLALHPLFQVLVHLRESGEYSQEIAGGGRFTMIVPEFDTVKFDLAFDFFADGDGFGGGISYRTDLYDRSTVELLADRLQRVLSAFALSPDVRLGTIDVLGSQERVELLGAWSDGGPAEGAAVSSIPELLEPSREFTGTAIVCAGRSIDYPELHRRSDRLAALLQARGAGVETFVSIALPRSIDMIVALVAVLKSGAGFLPLDMRYPAERLQLMVADANPVVVLADSSTGPALPEPAQQRAVLLDDPAVRDELAQIDIPVLPMPHGDNPAFFMFTSGSTGVPKGVLGTHAAMANRLAWQPVRFPIETPDVRLAQGALSFLDPCLEFIAGLASGCTLVLADDAEARDIEAIARLIRDNPIAQVTAVPTTVSALIDVDPQAVGSVRRWVSSGEPLTPMLLDRLRSVAPDSEIVNSYGATETAGGIVRGVQGDRLQVGRPVPATRVLVLDENLAPAPIGVVGEVYVAGRQLARGYWRRAGLSAARFIANPYPAHPGERIYRTGDRARWNAEGVLEFTGRTDHQVKLRGFRIELGEVEAALRSAPGVALAAARVYESENGPALAGYATALHDDVVAAVFVATVRAHLASSLPGYMLPSSVTLLEAMPLTASGKLDRVSLPAPRVTTVRDHQEPATETERVVARVLEELLGVERVGRSDGFFALGGDSIVSVQFAARAREAGLELTPQLVFENPTVAELAAALDSLETIGADAAGAAEVETAAPMSASGLDADALAALQSSWGAQR